MLRYRHNHSESSSLSTALRQLSLLSTSLTLLQRSKSALLLRLLDLIHNGILESLRLGKGSPAVNNLAIGGDKELLKVPLNALHAQEPRLLLFQESPDRCSVFAIHIQFSKNGEGYAVIDLTERLDIIVRARVLAAELVARETDDGEVFGVLGLQALVELLKTLKLGRKAAFRGCVHDQHNLAVQRGEGEGRALFCLDAGFG